MNRRSVDFSAALWEERGLLPTPVLWRLLTFPQTAFPRYMVSSSRAVLNPAWVQSDMSVTKVRVGVTQASGVSGPSKLKLELITYLYLY